jgi:Tripartite tricarboxylate transporter TctB family
MTDSPTPAEDGGMRTAVVEAVVAALLLLFGAVIAFESWRLGARWSDDGPGAGYFPFYVGLIICVASAGILFKALRTLGSDREVFVDRPSLKRVLQVLVPALVFFLMFEVWFKVPLFKGSLDPTGFLGY